MALAALCSMTEAEFQARVTNRNILLLSPSIKLSYSQLRILSYGLKFVPAPYPLSSLHSLDDGFAKCIRNMRWRHLFAELGDNSSFVKTSLWKPSKHNPPVASRNLEAAYSQFFDLVKTEIRHQDRKALCSASSNLSFDERLALKTLSKMEDLVIKPADKNLGMTVMSRHDYVAKVEEHLSLDAYSLVSGGRAAAYPKDTILTIMNRVLKLFSDESMHDQSFVDHVKFLTRSKEQLVKAHEYVPPFYALPKVHKCKEKDLSDWQVRPIVAGHSALTAPLSVLADHVLGPLINGDWIQGIESNLHDSVLKDSTSLVRSLEKMEFPQNSLLVTFDVKALYTSIDNGQAQRCLRSVLNGSSLPQRVKAAVLTCLSTVLNFNFFEFNGKFYKQNNGFAMGTPLAPGAANLMLQYLEVTELFPKLDPQVRQSLLYRRYIDDGFFVWPSSRESLDIFIDNLRQVMRPLELTFVISDQSIEFLDLVIFKGPRFQNSNHFDLKVHQKLFNKYLYLPPKSFHPRHTFLGMIKGELIRYVRICSSRPDFEQMKSLFAERLRSRGFSPRLIRSGLRQIHYEHRARYLYENSEKTSSRGLTLVVPHHPSVAFLNWKSLMNSPVLGKPRSALEADMWPNQLRKAWSKIKSLGSMLIRARLPRLKSLPPPARAQPASSGTPPDGRRRRT